MPYLVDGDNLLGTWPGRARSDADKRWLSAELARMARREHRKVVVVYDGPEPPVPHPSHDVVFSGGGRRADDVIVERLRRESDPRGWIVVTSDRSLADQCRYMGARVERSDRFRPRLRATGGPEKPDGPVDVADWEAWFERGGDVADDD